MTSFDNNEDKVCLLLKDDIDGSRVRSRTRSRVRLYDHRSCDHGVTLDAANKTFVISILALRKTAIK